MCECVSGVWKRSRVVARNIQMVHDAMFRYSGTSLKGHL